MKLIVHILLLLVFSISTLPHACAGHEDVEMESKVASHCGDHHEETKSDSSDCESCWHKCHEAFQTIRFKQTLTLKTKPFTVQISLTGRPQSSEAHLFRPPIARA